MSKHTTKPRKQSYPLPKGFPYENYYVVPLVDGIRFFAIQGCLYSAEGKHFPNKYLQEKYHNLPNFVEGFIISKELNSKELYKTLRNTADSSVYTTQLVMYDIQSDDTADERVDILEDLIDYMSKKEKKDITVVKHHSPKNAAAYTKLVNKLKAEGYTGLWLKNKNSGYMFGQVDSALIEVKFK